MPPKPFRFLDLPGELRNNVYDLLFDPAYLRIEKSDGQHTYKYHLSILRTNRQIYREARKIFRQQNKFVRIETPWSQAQQRVQMEGNVPSLAEGQLAERISNLYMRVVIDSPEHGQSIDHIRSQFVVLAEDLEAFTRMWYYADLSYAGDLNKHLRLQLHLQNPMADAVSESTPLSKVLQRKLLLPFGNVKGLNHLQVFGDGIDRDGVEETMRTQMAVPYDSPERCIEECTRLKDLGNVALKTSPKRALELYIEAFEKLHIICKGRRRSIWGDPWFETVLQGGPFDGQHGQYLRIQLRIKLVANVIQAYLDLEDYPEARFWGERTIDLMIATMGGEEEPVVNFPARNAMGKIYYRTGVACKQLGEEADARRFLRVAAKYLPHDKKVLEMLSSVALRLG